jgi:hypothetical protein
MNEKDDRRSGRIRVREGVRVMKKKCWLKGSAEIAAILVLVVVSEWRPRKGKGKEGKGDFRF